MMRSTATSSKMQFLHFGGSSSLNFVSFFWYVFNLYFSLSKIRPHVGKFEHIFVVERGMVIIVI